MTEQPLLWQGHRVSFAITGDSAVTVSVGEGVDPAVNDRVRLFAEAVAAAGIPGFTESTAGYRTATVYYDAYALYRGLDKLERLFPELGADGPESLAEVVCAVLLRIWEELKAGNPLEPRRIEIPVVYGGRYGPDLEAAALHCGMTPEELIRIHSGLEYRVFMIGFVPGFPYLGGMAETIAVPRKDTPRVSVPAGSVAIGGGQTGIYPMEAPGGWNLIGRTPLRLFDAEREEPSLLKAGDRVRFVPVTAADWPEG